MNRNDYLSITPEIQQAIADGKPVVALESTILSHGMPYPQNVEFAHKVEEIVRAEGAPTRAWRSTASQFKFPKIKKLPLFRRNRGSFCLYFAL